MHTKRLLAHRKPVDNNRNDTVDNNRNKKQLIRTETTKSQREPHLLLALAMAVVPVSGVGQIMELLVMHGAGSEIFVPGAAAAVATLLTYAPYAVIGDGEPL